MNKLEAGAKLIESLSASYAAVMTPGPGTVGPQPYELRGVLEVINNIANKMAEVAKAPDPEDIPF
jgi:hypothetical protein